MDRGRGTAERELELTVRLIDAVVRRDYENAGLLPDNRSNTKEGRKCTEKIQKTGSSIRTLSYLI